VLLDVRGGAGDAIMATEAARQLAELYPGVHVVLYVLPGQGELVGLCPWLAEVHELPRGDDIDEAGYDRAFHLRDLARSGWWRGQRHILELMGASLGVPLRNRPASLYIEPQALAWARGFWGDRDRPWIVIHPYSSAPEKSWPVGHWHRLIPDLPGTVVAVGGPPEPLPCPHVESSWQQTAGLLALADVQIGNDSGPMHLAAGTSTCRIVAMWGATAPVNSGVATRGRVINLVPQREACGRWGIPCHSHCEFGRDSGRFCMSQITPERVRWAVEELLRPRERPQITFVLVAWNAGTLTARMLDQIGATATTQYEVVIVDNGSRAAEWRLIAAAAKRLRRQAPVTVVRNGRNLGYPAAANIGLRTATGRVLWLLNSDLEICETGWDRRVWDFVQAHATVGIVSATANMGAYQFGAPPVLGRTAAGDHVNGCSLAIRRECWWQVGDLDEGFSPGLLEETDFCLRAWRAGWQSWHIPAAVEHQHHGVVDSNIGGWPAAVRERNRAYFARKWAGATGDLSGQPVVSPV